MDAVATYERRREAWSPQWEFCNTKNNRILEKIEESAASILPFFTSLLSGYILYYFCMFFEFLKAIL